MAQQQQSVPSSDAEYEQTPELPLIYGQTAVPTPTTLKYHLLYEFPQPEVCTLDHHNILIAAFGALKLLGSIFSFPKRSRLTHRGIIIIFYELLYDRNIWRLF